MSGEAEMTTTVPGGGIGWQSGSLVGSQNPANFGYRFSHVHKRYKRADGEADDAESQLPSSLVVQFQNRQGELVGDTLDIPTQSNVDAMSALIHSLLENDDDDDHTNANTPYAFYAQIQKDGLAEDVEITSTLAHFIQTHNVSTEHLLKLTYQPLAIFKVRPVTRCTDTMPGHTEAILHVSYSPDGTLLFMYSL
jgi:ribosome assembly protein 4